MPIVRMGKMILNTLIQRENMLLEIFRNHKRWLMFIAMVLVIPSFVVTGIYSYNRMMSDDGAIAKVDNVSITPQQYDEAKRRMLDNLRNRLGDQFKANMLETEQGKMAVLLNIMNQRALSGETSQENVVISEETAIAIIKTFPAFQENGKFSAERYSNYLASVGYSDEYFVQMIRGDIARDFLNSGIERSAFTPDSIAREVNTLLTERRSIAVSRIPAASFLSGVSATDDEANKFWKDNQKAFELPDEIDVQYVVLTPDQFRNVEPTEEDVRTFYEQNQNRFRAAEQRRASHILIDTAKGDAAAKKQAEDILAQVKKNPKKFAELAKKFSADPGSAREGGDLGYFGQGVMVAPFDKAVFDGKKGDIVGPVKTDFGYHIIRIDDVQGAKVRSLADVRSEIVALYKEQEAQKAFAKEAENFTNLVYEQSDSLDGVAEKYGLKILSAKDLTAEGPQDKALAQFLNAHVMEALFADECLREKRNTQAIEVAQNTLVAARVAKFTPSHVRAFEEVKAEIIASLKNDKAMKLAVKEGEQTLNSLNAGAKIRVKFEPSFTVTRANPGAASMELVNAVMRADAKKLPAYVGLSLGNEYVIAKVESSDIPSASDKQISAAKAELAQMYARADGVAYLDELRAKHDAKIISKAYLSGEKDKDADK